MPFNSNIKYFAYYFKRHIFFLIIGTLSIFFLSLLILPTPLITRRIIDNTLPQKNLQELVFLIGLVFALLIVTRLLSYFQSMLFYKINSRVILSLRTDMLKKINRLPMSIFKKYSTGYLMSRINEDTGRLQSLFVDTIVSIFKDVLTFIVGVVAIFFIHWKLALMALAILPFYAISAIYFSKVIKKRSSDYYEKSAQTNKHLEESLSMFELTKIFLREKFSVFRYFKSAKTTYRSDIKLTRTSLLNNLITGFIAGISPIVIIGYGGYEIIQGRLTIGLLIAFNSFVGYLFGPTNRLINVNIQIQKSLVALKRVKEIFDLPEENIKIIKNNLTINKLEFENVNFSYFNNEKNKLILKNISFTIKKGEKIGIVGSSGSGKTTLIRLLSGLYEVNSGKILLNGNLLKHDEIIGLRKYSAIVEQEPFLFDDTVYNNIKFGNPRATREEIIQAAKDAFAYEFIKDLKDEFDTIVGNRGGNLSVGQKQRIALARALVKKPKILILDEATSNIDPISESYINKVIFNLPKDMIVIIIAHKLKQIKKCDKIMVLQSSKIIQSGTHNELINSRGLYKKLYET